MDSDSQRFASVAGECARTSTEALDNVRKFITELNNADNKREVCCRFSSLTFFIYRVLAS